VVINLVHPTPAPLSDVRQLQALSVGPLAEQLAFHRELSALARSERAEMAQLKAEAGEAAVVEVPMLDSDVHDLAGLAALAEILVPRS
jgi:hypothetical protein